MANQREQIVNMKKRKLLCTPSGGERFDGAVLERLRTVRHGYNDPYGTVQYGTVWYVTVCYGMLWFADFTL